MNCCVLCKSSKRDDVRYGEYLQNGNIGVHTFCLYLSSNLSQNGKDDEGFFGFLEPDINREVRRISELKCCYCHKYYANIGCCASRCRRTFHFICGIENNVENQFCHDFRSFCHRHVRKVRPPPSNESCLICYESLSAGGKRARRTNSILVPCCRSGWFHKFCLQKFAQTAGYFFKCPLCNDTKTFRKKLPARGIFIPNRDAAWELEPNAYAELLERPNTCAAQQCGNDQGRNAESDENPFVMCSICGSTAMHQNCLPKNEPLFHCDDCKKMLNGTDSGRDSLNSQLIYDNEDECIDVCLVSDDEDSGTIGGSIASISQSGGSKSIKEIDMESSDEEEVAKCAARIRKRRLCIDSEDFDFPHTSRKIIRSDWESNSDSSEEELIIPRPSVKKKRLRVVSENSNSNETEIFISGREKSPNIFNNNNKRGEFNFKTDDLAAKRLKNKSENSDSDFVESPIKRKSLNILTDSEDDDDDDPLENFHKFAGEKCAVEEKVKERAQSKIVNLKSIENSPKKDGIMDISCIAKRTRRSYSMKNEKMHTETSSLPLRLRSNSVCDRTEYKMEVPFEMSQIYEKVHKSNETLETLSNFESNSNEEWKKKSQFELSCIANRTRRRKSLKFSANMYNIHESSDEFEAATTQPKKAPRISNSKIESDKLPQHNNSIIPQTNYRINHTYEIVDSDSESNSNEISVEKKNRKFEISCIANRTRRRESLKSQGSRQPEIVENVDCCSDTSNSSDMHNIQLTKRCIRRISSYSSDEFETITTTRPRKVSTNSNVKAGIAKLPSHNNTVLLRSNYRTHHAYKNVNDSNSESDSSYTSVERNNKFNKSCVANRTRRRKSLKSNGHQQPEIDKTLDCNSNISSSSDELDTATTTRLIKSPSFSKIKTETKTSSSVLLDKLPQHNYAAFLQPNSSKKHTYGKVHESNKTSKTLSGIVDSDSESNSSNTSVEDRNSVFELSCIANRTRRRQSLKSNVTLLPKIDEILDCS